MVVILLFVGVATGFSFTQAPTYTASSKLLIGQEQKSDTVTDLNNEVLGLQALMETMVEGVQTRPIAEDTIQRLDLSMSPENLLDNLKVERIGTTQFIEVSYESSSSGEAQRIANTVGEVFAKHVSELSPSASAITVSLWERAVSPEPSSGLFTMARNILLGLMVGLILGIGLAFLLELLDTRWRSTTEVERVSGVPALGVIPTFKVRRFRNRRRIGTK